jgi:hypothetical protein
MEAAALQPADYLPHPPGRQTERVGQLLDSDPRPLLDQPQRLAVARPERRHVR